MQNTKSYIMLNIIRINICNMCSTSLLFITDHLLRESPKPKCLFVSCENIQQLQVSLVTPVKCQLSKLLDV